LADVNWPSPEITACPYPYWEILRSEAPVHHVPGTRTYLISSWEAIHEVTRKRDVFEQAPSFPLMRPEYELDIPTVHRYAPEAAISSNGDDHKAKRAWGLRLVQGNRLRAYEPLIARICDELIDGFIDRGGCEFRWAFAEQLPSYVMMELLGLPREDAKLFQADELSVGDDTGSDAYPSYTAINDYVLRAVQDRLEAPGDDFLSEILQDQVRRDGAVDINMQVAQGANLILAGSETTAHVLVNMMRLLCGHPDVMERVRGDRAALRMVLEETMRLEAPVQWLPRITASDTVLCGVEIPAGSTLHLLFGSGNRDERKFDDPGEFRPFDRERLAKNQLGFGRGSHLCLGAPLARLEGEIGFERLLARLTNLRVVTEKSDLSNVQKGCPTGLEGFLDAGGCMHAPKTLVIAYDAATR
jgi:cytochrome P450